MSYRREATWNDGISAKQLCPRKAELSGGEQAPIRGGIVVCGGLSPEVLLHSAPFVGEHAKE